MTLTEKQVQILTALSHKTRWMTASEIASAVPQPHGYQVKAVGVGRHLWRLTEADRLVERQGRYMNWWRITDAGRAALKKVRGE